MVVLHVVSCFHPAFFIAFDVKMEKKKILVLEPQNVACFQTKLITKNTTNLLLLFPAFNGYAVGSPVLPE